MIASLLVLSPKRVWKLLEEGDISQAQVTKFYDGAQAFYVQAMEYALENLPMNKGMLHL